MSSIGSKRAYLFLLATSIASLNISPAEEPAPRRLSMDPPQIAADKTVNYNYDIVHVRAPRFGDEKATRWAEVFNPLNVDPQRAGRKNTGKLRDACAGSRRE